MMYGLLIFLCTLGVPLYSMQRYVKEYVEHPERIELLYNAGVEAARLKNYNDAHGYFACLIDLMNNDDQLTKKCTQEQLEQLWYNKGNAAYQIKEYDMSLKAFERVVEYNSENELARQKIDYLKKLKEEQQNKDQKPDQEQQKDDQQNKKDSQDKDDKQPDDQNDSSDQSGEEQSKKDGQENEDDGAQKKGDKQGDQHDDQQNTQSSGNEKEAQEQHEKENSQKNDSRSPGQQKKEQIADQQSSNMSQERNSQDQEVSLNEQERQILAAVQALDEQMQKELEKQELKRARGNPYAYNNW